MNLRSKMKERAKKLLLPQIFIPALYSEEDVENIKYGIDFGSKDFSIITNIRLIEGRYEIVGYCVEGEIECLVCKKDK